MSELVWLIPVALIVAFLTARYVSGVLNYAESVTYEDIPKSRKQPAEEPQNEWEYAGRVGHKFPRFQEKDMPKNQSVVTVGNRRIMRR